MPVPSNPFFCQWQFIFPIINYLFHRNHFPTLGIQLESYILSNNIFKAYICCSLLYIDLKITCIYQWIGIYLANCKNICIRYTTFHCCQITTIVGMFIKMNTSTNIVILGFYSYVVDIYPFLLYYFYVFIFHQYCFIHIVRCIPSIPLQQVIN